MYITHKNVFMVNKRDLYFCLSTVFSLLSITGHDHVWNSPLLAYYIVIHYIYT